MLSTNSSILTIWTVAILILGSGCDGADENANPVVSGVYVASQGNFSDANGSLIVYNPDSKSTESVIADAGSTIQSILIDDKSIFVLENTGGRINVYATGTAAQTAQITGLASPRYMAVSDARIGYVTNLFKAGFVGGSVSVIDLVSNGVTATVDVGDNPEGIAIAGDQVYVANHGFGEGRTLSVISLSSNQVVQTIDVGCDGPRSVFRDREDELWVVCTGKTLFDQDSNVLEQTPGEVVLVDGPTAAIVGRIPLSAQVSTTGPGQDAFYSEGDQELYVVVESNRILRFNTGSNVLAEDLGVFSGDPIGAVAYDAEADLLYLGRVPGFTSAGFVSIHDRAGTQLETFPAGIAPTFIAFESVE